MGALVRFYSVEEKGLNVFHHHPPACCLAVLALTPYCARHYKPSCHHFDQRIRSQLSRLADRGLKSESIWYRQRNYFRRIFPSTFKCHMLNINLFIADGVITSPAICLGIKEKKKALFHIDNTIG